MLARLWLEPTSQKIAVKYSLQSCEGTVDGYTFWILGGIGLKGEINLYERRRCRERAEVIIARELAEHGLCLTFVVLWY